MYRISLGILFTAVVLLPSVARAQQAAGLSPDRDMRDTPELGNRISTGSQQPLSRSRLSVVFAPSLRQSVELDKPVPSVVTSQVGVHPGLRLPHDGTAAEYQWSESASHLNESSKVDTSSHQSNRTTHIVIGVVAGVVGGVLLGKSVDKGRAGCGHEQSGRTCDWGSGVYEPLFGASGGAIGGVVGALLPHN